MAGSRDQLSDPLPEHEWRKNLIYLWFGMFMVGMGFSEVMPFISLYIATMGNYTPGQLSLYSGLAFSATFLVSAFISPLWGSLADRYGRKLMILRASAGMAFCLILMGFATNVWELIILRLLEGVFSGYMSNSQAIMATQVPSERSGEILGILATGNVTGNLFGPFIGGVISTIFGYRWTFFITGGILIAVFLLSLQVTENFVPVTKEANLSTKQVIHKLSNAKVVFGMFLTTLILQAANFSISPILSLYVKEIMHNSPSVTFFAGIVAAVPGIATLIAAPKFGALGDRIGTSKILIIGFILAIVFYIPMAFVTNIWELIILRFCIGISNACMLPSIQTILTKNSPQAVTGRIFSWNQSMQSAGNFIGPMLGAVVAAVFGSYSAVFLSTAVLVGINLFLVFNETKSLRA